MDGGVLGDEVLEGEGEVGGVDGDKAEGGVEGGNHSVFGCGDVFAEELGAPEGARGLNKVVECKGFEAAFENAAAHQPGVDEEGAALFDADDDGDETVVAKTIGQGKDEGDGVGILGKREEFGFGIAAGAEVELVGALGELRGTGDGEGIERLTGGDHLKALEELGFVFEGGFPGYALSLGAVLCGAGAVFSGVRDSFEEVFGGEEVKPAGGIFGKVRDTDIGVSLTNDSPFGGVVIEEDEAIEAEVEDLLDVCDIIGFGLPICDEAGDVVEVY